MSNLNFNIRSIYNFDLHAPAILGNGYQNAVVLALMDMETANKEIDVVSLHTNVFPYLPVGTPNDPKGYDYVKIKTTTGATTIIGLAWIKPETIVLVDSRTVTVTIGEVNASDIPRIKAALIQNGYSNIEIQIR